MLTYRQVATYLGNRIPFATAITDMQTVQTSGGYALYTVTHMGGGIAAYRFTSADQSLTLTSSRAWGPGQSYLDTPVAAVVQIGGKAAVFGAGLLNATGMGFSLGARGELTEQARLTGSGGFAADVTLLGSFQTPLGGFLYSARNNRTEFDTWRINADGSIRHIATGSLPQGPSNQGAEIDDMQVVGVGDRNFMLTASALGNYVSIQMLAGDGSLGQAQVLWSDRGDGIAAPSHIGTVTVQGVTYLVVASSQSSSLTVMRITYDGALQPVDHVIDELTTRFSGATAMETVMVEGRAFVFVGGRDDGISVFTVMPNGRLLHLATLADTDGRSLADVAAISAVVINGKIALFVSSHTERGFTHFVFDPGTIGETRTVGAGQVNGTAGDDLLRAGQGTTLIRGGAGDDVLIAGSTSVELHGGDGADIFVPTAIKGTITIRDYQHGIDRLDLSNLGMIRSVMQLTWRGQWDGIRIVFGDTTIVIRTRDGSTLQSRDFTNALFPVAHYEPPRPSVNVMGTRGNDTLAASAGGADIYGLAGNDLLTGGTGNDTLWGGLGLDTLAGGAARDRLMGDADNDLMRGGDGNDELLGGTGNDTMLGGSGDDSLYGQSGNDDMHGEDGDDHIEDMDGSNKIWAGDGADFITTGSGNDSIVAEAGEDTVLAGEGNDRIWGGPGNDSLAGGAGHDNIHGGSDQDFLEGGDGDDTLNGAGGSDTLWGGLGNDQLWGGAGNDLLYGGQGSDRMLGGDGNDQMLGGAGHDRMFGGGGADRMRGEAGNDMMQGQAGRDHISGAAGNDTIYGGLDNDRLYGDAGHDHLSGEAGNDLLAGGLGNDRLFGNGGNDHLLGHEGNDVLDGGTGNDSIQGGAGNDRIFGRLGRDLLGGGAGNDTILGGDGHDRISGHAGNDRLYGDRGNDRVAGGAGNDVIVGGAGNDLLIGEVGNDRLDGGQGFDRLNGGGGNDRLTDRLGDNRLWGGTGNDTLIAGSGRDTLDGGAGRDRMTGGLGADVFVFNAASLDRSVDLITDFGRGADRIDLHQLNLTFIGDAAFSGARQVRSWDGPNGGMVAVDLNGDGRADLTIGLGHHGPALASDFIL